MENMKKQTIDEARRCPKCGQKEKQVKKGRDQGYHIY
jgi:Zn finger protein HypA/HybF involved in hydrogenase expression